MKPSVPAPVRQQKPNVTVTKKTASVLTISLLIGQLPNKCVAESNRSLGLHDLLNSASHDTKYGRD